MFVPWALWLDAREASGGIGCTYFSRILSGLYLLTGSAAVDRHQVAGNRSEAYREKERPAEAYFSGSSEKPGNNKADKEIDHSRNKQICLVGIDVTL